MQMMKREVRAMNVLPVIGVLIAVACGGSRTPPAPPGVSAGDTSALPPAASSPAPPSSASSAEAAPSASASASTPEDAGAQPGPIVEQKDECTPVGVDFERRARPKLKDCYTEGKKKNPNLEGTVKIKVTVDVKGKIEAVKIVEKTLPDPVAECMLGVVKKTPFPEVDKCWDASLTIPITFPTPR